MKKVTIVIADDHTLIRETWSLLIGSNARYQVIGEACDGEEVVKLAAALQPDMILMDINLPGMRGIEATEVILKAQPDIKVLGVSLHTQPTYARKIMQKGAMGYLTKSSSKEELFEALAEVSNNRKYVCKEIKNILFEQMLNGDDPGKAINSLSQREVEVISFLRKGYSSKEIAAALSISAKTTEVHRYNILKKLNLRNRTALINHINNSELNFTD